MSISSEITRITNAKNTLKTKLNAKNDNEHQITDETIDEYGDFVDSIIASGGVKLYSSTTERDEDENVEEGDICIVLHCPFVDMYQGFKSYSFYFPKYVYLEEQTTVSQTTFTTGFLNFSFTLTNAQCTITGPSTYGRTYTSTDGHLYTRVEDDPVMSQTSISFTISSNFTETMSKFIKGNSTASIQTLDFGFYEYVGEAWRYKEIYDNNTLVTIADKLLLNYKAYTNTGMITGSMPNNGALSYTPSTSSQSIPAGYTSGGTIAAISTQTKTATPTTSSQTIEPDSGKYLSSVTVNAVTSSIDNNIVAENIKKDISILGVTGTYEGSGGGGTVLNVTGNNVSVSGTTLIFGGNE